MARQVRSICHKSIVNTMGRPDAVELRVAHLWQDEVAPRLEDALRPILGTIFYDIKGLEQHIPGQTKINDLHAHCHCVW